MVNFMENVLPLWILLKFGFLSWPIMGEFYQLYWISYHHSLQDGDAPWLLCTLPLFNMKGLSVFIMIHSTILNNLWHVLCMVLKINGDFYLDICVSVCGGMCIFIFSLLCQLLLLWFVHPPSPHYIPSILSFTNLITYTANSRVLVFIFAQFSPALALSNIYRLFLTSASQAFFFNLQFP